MSVRNENKLWLELDESLTLNLRVFAAAQNGEWDDNYIAIVDPVTAAKFRLQKAEEIAV